MKPKKPNTEAKADPGEALCASPRDRQVAKPPIALSGPACRIAPRRSRKFGVARNGATENICDIEASHTFRVVDVSVPGATLVKPKFPRALRCILCCCV